MLLKNQFFDIKITRANIDWYKSKSYVCNLRDLISVEAKDLTIGSRCVVGVICDYCGCLIKKQFQQYVRDNLRGIINKDACKKCYPLKVKESNMKKYGVENVNQLGFVKEKTKETNIKKYGSEYFMQTDKYFEKVKKTNLEKYGVECVLQNEEIKKRIKQTNIDKFGVPYPTMNEQVVGKVKQSNLEKYGVEWSLQNKEVREKSKETNLEKYGVANPFQNETVKKKIKVTNIKRYGVENPSQSEKIKKKKQHTLLKNWGVKNAMHNPIISSKVRKSLYKNSNVPTSKQQKYLCDLLNGELNYNIGNYNVDILLEDNIVIEYNGGGHNLQVKLGNMTENEFLNKERRRTYYLRRRGYKVIKIISPNDYLAQDNVIISEIEKAKEYFDLGHSLYIIDFGEVINNETYGKLRRLN